MEIIPAILETTWPEVEKKLRLVDGLTEWIQLDVSDGVFAPVKTWNNPADLLGLSLRSKLEVHLMVADAEAELRNWLLDSVIHMVIHAESLDHVQHRVLDIGKEVVLGFKIETPWEPYLDLIQKIGRVLFLSVEPGYQGQEFDRRVINKITSLRKVLPNIYIAVDGGINPAIARQLESAGADGLVVGSYIFSETNPAGAIKSLSAAQGSTSAT